jgi:hypothetical protein
MPLADRLDVALQETAEEGIGAGLTVPCKVASIVWEDAQRRFKRYSGLINLLLLLALAGIAAAIVFFFVADAKTSAGIVSLISGLVSGGLTAPIYAERDVARKDRDEAQKIVGNQCKGQTAQAVVDSLAG